MAMKGIGLLAVLVWTLAASCGEARTPAWSGTGDAWREIDLSAGTYNCRAQVSDNYRLIGRQWVGGVSNIAIISSREQINGRSHEARLIRYGGTSNNTGTAIVSVLGGTYTLAVDVENTTHAQLDSLGRGGTGVRASWSVTCEARSP